MTNPVKFLQTAVKASTIPQHAMLSMTIVKLVYSWNIGVPT
jgi:hypothetical protein